MDLFTVVWLAEMLNGCSALFLGVGAVSLAGAVIASCVALMEYDEDTRKRCFKGIKLLSIIAIVSALIAVTLPPREAFYLHYGVEAAKNFTTDVSETPLGSKALKLLERKIDNALELQDVTEEEK